jgi:hypothetical protein
MVLSSNHRHIWNKELKTVYHWYSLPPSQPSVPYHVCGTICIYLLINIYSKF